VGFLWQACGSAVDAELSPVAGLGLMPDRGGEGRRRRSLSASVVALGSVDADHGVRLSPSRKQAGTGGRPVPAGCPSAPSVRPACPPGTRSPDGFPSGLMRETCDLEILIPSLNEAHRLPGTLVRTVDYLEKQPYSSSVVVVDNGSIDQTVDLVTLMSPGRVPISVIGCARPGKGAAVRRGIETSCARFVGYMDADLATPIETLDCVVPLLKSGFRAVVGSRRVDGAVLAERQSFLRLAGGMAFRMVASRVLRGVTDSQCGFKFFAGDLARSVARHLSIDGFAFDVELLSAITRLGVPVTEIPVIWSDKQGSSLRARTNGARAIADVMRLARRAAAR
jgi:dolichyl-phosphate beta-glucosyltransferase